MILLKSKNAKMGRRQSMSGGTQKTHSGDQNSPPNETNQSFPDHFQVDFRSTLEWLMLVYVNSPYLNFPTFKMIQSIGTRSASWKNWKTRNIITIIIAFCSRKKRNHIWGTKNSIFCVWRIMLLTITYNFSECDYSVDKLIKWLIV